MKKYLQNGEDIRGRNFTEISYWEQLAVWNRYYVDEWSAKEKEWFLELFIGCCSDMVKYWKESKYDFQFTFSKWHIVPAKALCYENRLPCKSAARRIAFRSRLSTFGTRLPAF